jgi:hypothetical protein
MRRLTDTEIDSLAECECGHWAEEHDDMAGCLANSLTDEDAEIPRWSVRAICACLNSPQGITITAVETIIEARIDAFADQACAGIRAARHYYPNNPSIISRYHAAKVIRALARSCVQ